MSKLTVEMVTLSVRRDMSTTLETTVPKYEEGVLKSIFGKENVAPVATAEPCFYEVDTDTEFDRLCAKYGGVVVEKIFGEEGAGRLKELVEKAVAKPAIKAAKV